ncbi:hypothetical protein L0222_27175, partial [bacterium]|nr:hypothetical protein [bacterium]
YRCRSASGHNTPDTTITSSFCGTTVTTTSVTVTWTGTDNTTPTGNLVYSYKLDGGSYSAYTTATSQTFNNLTNGSHTVSVKAKDEAGNEDPSPAQCSFTSDAAYIYADDFNNGTLTWVEEKPTVTEPGDGFLHLIPANKKAIATSDPVFAGCQNCTITADIQFSGGTNSRSWILTHRLDKDNQMEVLFKEEEEKVIVKERTPAGIIKKEKATFTLDPNTNYNVVITYDGTTYTVTINGTPVISAFTSLQALPSGIIGAQSKDNTTLLDNVSVN